MVKPLRFPWNGFPDALIHAQEDQVKGHVTYKAAKAGNYDAAIQLVLETMSDDVVMSLLDHFVESSPALVSVHAEESVGVNAIPEVMADILAHILGWDVERFVVQANVVNHTGADGFSRMARQALFSGDITAGRNYLIVDDFIGQGGTIANLRGHILAQGGQVLGATVLTGKHYSAKLAINTEQLHELRNKHGQIEKWWQERTGFDFECLTASEARYLFQTPTSERIRSRLDEIGNG